MNFSESELGVGENVSGQSRCARLRRSGNERHEDETANRQAAR
jgi:hypothetical protein